MPNNMGRFPVKGRLGSFTHPNCCKECGQPLPESIRYGVRLTTIKLKMFDTVARRPGISERDLFAAVYPDREFKKLVATHVAQINDMFVHTNIKIVGIQYSGYHIEGIE